VPNPEVGFRFQLNDLVAIIGSAEAREHFHRFAERREHSDSKTPIFA